MSPAASRRAPARAGGAPARARAARAVARVAPPRDPRVPWRPTRAQLAAAAGKTVPDILAPGLRILFCGINPGLYSGAVGHHFARPGNRFWSALHAGGLTDRILSPFEEHLLLDRGLGVTNLVARATATAEELAPDELVRGGRRLAAKVRRERPAWVAVLGLGAYRRAFARPKAGFGPQPERLGPARLWLLPNPSGLNASWQLPALARAFAELAAAAGLASGPGAGSRFDPR